MAIRAIWGFTHLPKNTDAGADSGGYGLSYSNYGIVPGISQYTSMFITTAGGLQMTTQNVGLPIYITVPANRVTNGVAKKSYMGFKIFNSARNATSTGCVQIGGKSFLNLNALNAPVGNAYYELCVDRIASTITVKINGVVKEIITDSVATSAYSGTNNILFGFPANPGQFGYLVFSNFYFLDDTEDNTACSWLGEVTATPITLATAVGESWTTTAADLKTGLNTPFTTQASITAPLAKSPTSNNTPLMLDLATVISVNAKVHAVSLYGTVKKETSNVSLIKNELTGDTTTITGPYVVPPDNPATFGFSYSFGVFNKNPDGVNWTPALINRTKWKLTPSATME